MRTVTDRTSGSVRLGLTLRSVLVTPRAGHAASIRTVGRRVRAGERLAEGWSTYVLAAVGGAAGMSLWLRLGALLGWRTTPQASVDADLLAAAFALGAVLAVAAQFLWAAIAAPIAARLAGSGAARDLRLVWGTAGLPQVLTLVALVPLDLAIAGPATFTAQRPPDAVATAWAALSIALHVTLALWSLWIFVRGVEVATALRPRRALLVAAGAPLCVALLLFCLALLGRSSAG